MGVLWSRDTSYHQYNNRSIKSTIQWMVSVIPDIVCILKFTCTYLLICLRHLDKMLNSIIQLICSLFDHLLMSVAWWLKWWFYLNCLNLLQFYKQLFRTLAKKTFFPMFKPCTTTHPNFTYTYDGLSSGNLSTVRLRFHCLHEAWWFLFSFSLLSFLVSPWGVPLYAT